MINYIANFVALGLHPVSALCYATRLGTVAFASVRDHQDEIASDDNATEPPQMAQYFD
ncbi:hypothetical protein NVIE_1735 [Nitrososphaera viennensis EN76]|uniref:Uncharacterized protein n=1 Tax=Nitrososphaera viennensis EN76 TaxID=926571 RepID=A0A060HR26_9ARCH|nr:hypothetical protein NVIE_1735 [Nitrososphaera viennensis EN76]